MKGKLVIEKYWNGYRPFYVYKDGTRELLHTAMPTKADAVKVGKMEIAYINGKEEV